MQVTDVRTVIAIGPSGQFDLRGRLSWEGNRGREYVADVERFFDLTIMGRHTFTAVPDFAFKDRDIVVPPTAQRTCWRAFRAALSSSGAAPQSTLPARLSSAIGTSTGARPIAGSIARASLIAEMGERAESAEFLH